MASHKKDTQFVELSKRIINGKLSLSTEYCNCSTFSLGQRSCEIEEDDFWKQEWRINIFSVNSRQMISKAFGASILLGRRHWETPPPPQSLSEIDIIRKFKIFEQELPQAEVQSGPPSLPPPRCGSRAGDGWRLDFAPAYHSPGSRVEDVQGWMCQSDCLRVLGLFYQPRSAEADLGSVWPPGFREEGERCSGWARSMCNSLTARHRIPGWDVRRCKM